MSGFDLVGGADDLVGDRLLLDDARDRGDGIVERLQVLDVDGGDDVDPGVEQLVDVLPAFLVARSRDVGVREFVDEGDLGSTGQDGIDVHVVKNGALVLAAAARHDLEASEESLRVRPSVALARRQWPSFRPSSGAPPTPHGVSKHERGCALGRERNSWLSPLPWGTCRNVVQKRPRIGLCEYM